MLRPLARLSQSHVRSQTPPPPPLHPLRWTSSLPCLSGHADTQPLPVRSLASRSVLSCRTRFAQSSCCLSLLFASVCSASERAGEARWDRAGASIQRARRAGGLEGGREGGEEGGTAPAPANHTSGTIRRLGLGLRQRLPRTSRVGVHLSLLDPKAWDLNCSLILFPFELGKRSVGRRTCVRGAVGPALRMLRQSKVQTS